MFNMLNEEKDQKRGGPEKGTDLGSSDFDLRTISSNFLLIPRFARIHVTGGLFLVISRFHDRRFYQCIPRSSALCVDMTDEDGGKVLRGTGMRGLYFRRSEVHPYFFKNKLNKSGRPATFTGEGVVWKRTPSKFRSIAVPPAGEK